MVTLLPGDELDGIDILRVTRSQAEHLGTDDPLIDKRVGSHFTSGPSMSGGPGISVPKTKKFSTIFMKLVYVSCDQQLTKRLFS